MNPFNMFKPKDKPLALICPHCHQADVSHKNLARRIGGTVGAVAGAASGVSGILSAARLGLVIGMPAGPVAATLTAVASATLRAIVGGTIGLEIGASLGGLLDKHVLQQSDTCRHCGFSFSPEEPTPRRYQRQDWARSMAFPMGHDNDDDDPDNEPQGGLPCLT